MRPPHFAPRMLGLLLVLIGACKDKPVEEGGSCAAKEDCAEGLSCLDGKCTKLGEPAPAALSPFCEQLAALEGEWTFDTTVIGAHDLESRGINGHYQMTVTRTECSGQAQLTKTGHDSVKYSESKIQRSDTTLAESARVTNAIEAAVSLKGKPTHTFTFMVREGQLFGFWQATGDDWESSGRWGFLRGVEAGQTLVEPEDFSAQPCEIGCMTRCDVARREIDQTLDSAGLGSCLTACKAGEVIDACKPASGLPAELRLAVHGPVANPEALCSKAGPELLGPSESGAPHTCDAPMIKEKPSERVLDKRALGGSFAQAKLLQIGRVDVGYQGVLVLALQTDSGWYWTDPLYDLSVSGVGGRSIWLERAVLRARELLPAEGREAVVEFAIEDSDSDMGVNEIEVHKAERVAVCTRGAPPLCMLLTSEWSSERGLIERKGDDPKDHPDLFERQGKVYFSVLPEGRVSISTPPDAAPEDRKLAGIYSWE